ncbi:MAG: hypothetical protein ROY99_09590 [Ignavibacterium sp.]|jgi:hypothetical protein|nr:hypothetical protein [Ignavibacterium sp.]
MAKRKNQSDHDDMVKTTVNYIVSNLYTDEKADIDDYETPTKIIWSKTNDGHVPDVTAKYKDVEHIWEIETEDSISLDHTKSQWQLFSTFATQHYAIFHIVVPEGFS